MPSSKISPKPATHHIITGIGDELLYGVGDTDALGLRVARRWGARDERGAGAAAAQQHWPMIVVVVGRRWIKRRVRGRRSLVSLNL